MNTTITEAMLVKAIEPYLTAETLTLMLGMPSWNIPSFSEARRLTEMIGMQWDFESWAATLHSIQYHHRLGGIGTRLYKGTIDQGEGGTKIFRAPNVDHAMAQLTQWSEGGDWKEFDPTDPACVLLRVENIEDPNDCKETHWRPEVGEVSK